MVYGDFDGPGRRKNKANSKPICQPSAQAIPKACGFEAATRPEFRRRGYLKKQTQFAGGDIGAKAYLKGDYGNIQACGGTKKQSQSKPIAGLWLEILNKTGGEKFPSLAVLCGLKWLTGLPAGAEERFEVTLDPGPVQDDVCEHQDGENYGQVEMDAPPFVTIHRPEKLNLYRSPAAAKPLAVTGRAGRQNVFHKKAGES